MAQTEARLLERLRRSETRVSVLPDGRIIARGAAARSHLHACARGTAPPTSFGVELDEPSAAAVDASDADTAAAAAAAAPEIELMPEEALYLFDVVRCVRVDDGDGDAASCHGAADPPNGDETRVATARRLFAHGAAEAANRGRTAFGLAYAAFAHYRAAGFVVRRGSQFGADFVLYRDAPSRAHAQFCVTLVDGDGAPGGVGEVVPLGALKARTRLAGGVRKAVRLCYVTAKAAPAEQGEGHGDDGQTAAIALGTVRELVVLRGRAPRAPKNTPPKRGATPATASPAHDGAAATAAPRSAAKKRKRTQEQETARGSVPAKAPRVAERSGRCIVS